MKRKITKGNARVFRVRNRLRSVSADNGRLRLSVFRSRCHICAQVIDDSIGETVASASTMESALGVGNGGNIQAAEVVGKIVAGRAVEAGVESVYFDRGGYRYHGRVKALADAARSAGLQF